MTNLAATISPVYPYTYNTRAMQNLPPQYNLQLSARMGQVPHSCQNI